MAELTCVLLSLLLLSNRCSSQDPTSRSIIFILHYKDLPEYTFVAGFLYLNLDTGISRTRVGFGQLTDRRGQLYRIAGSVQW